MDIRAAEQQYNPYRIFTRDQWARLRDDTPMTLEPVATYASSRLQAAVAPSHGGRIMDA